MINKILVLCLFIVVGCASYHNQPVTNHAYQDGERHYGNPMWRFR